LELKGKSQYQAATVSGAQARRAVEQARRLYEGAVEIVTG
jgi:hypothetical protein